MTSKIKDMTNSLTDSRNPYLLQHAQDPVDWHPWSSRAFMKAAAEDKPVFLSIGYSTCHWCHVMEAESFSDPEIAAMMNDTFVCIKVDREERPDLDNIYMTFCQHMTGSGGWPMTIIMTPDKKPFFAGTYFPREERDGRIGMLQLIPKINDLWKHRKAKARATADEIFAKLQPELAPKPGARPHRLLMEKAFLSLIEHYDEKNGGFGKAPKFPVPANLLFLLRYWKRTGTSSALEMVLKTLRSMRRGGIYDHIGGGIHRYSTDEKWFLPHFEKMLYDQALTAMAFTEAYRATGEEDLRESATEILSYAVENLRSPEGVFYSAEDADSEGEEGKFYKWTTDEIEKILDKNEYAVARGLFNILKKGNYTAENGSSSRQNVLFRIMSDQHAADEFGISLDHFKALLQNIRGKMLDVRRKRVRPFTDTKVMTDWNGLMIAALAMAASAFNEGHFIQTAEKALNHILRTMREEGGALLHIRYDEETTVPACLDDYAYLLWGMVEMYQATFKVKHLTQAISLAEEMLRLFWDKENDGLFFTPRGSGPLPVRHKFARDSALPSGSAVAAMNLLRLGRLTARPLYEKRTAGIGRVFTPRMEQNPVSFIHLISVLDMALSATPKVIIIGDPEKEDTLNMVSALRRFYTPNTIAAFIPSTDPDSKIWALVPYVRNASPIGSQATAIVCKDFICHTPTTDPEEMISVIKDVEERSL